MKKRCVGRLLMLCLLIGLTACGEEKKEESVPAATTAIAETTVEATAAPTEPTVPVQLEDNVEGKVTDEWFMQLSNKYEAEQEELKRQMFELQEKLDKIDQMQTAKDDFLRAIRKFMEMQTLTPTLLRELIEKIEVFPVEGKGKDRTQRVIIHYRFVGRLDIPGIIERPHFILDSRQGVAIEYLPNAIEKKKSSQTLLQTTKYKCRHKKYRVSITEICYEHSIWSR